MEKQLLGLGQGSWRVWWVFRGFPWCLLLQDTFSFHMHLPLLLLVSSVILLWLPFASQTTLYVQ